MKLNKDGTATLLVKGAEVSLPVPTWGQVKERKEASEKLVESLTLIFTTVLDTLTDQEKGIYDRILKERGTRKVDAEGRTADDEYNELPEDGQERVMSLLKSIEIQTNTGQELSAQWWADTIKILAETEVEPTDLPAGLTNTNSITAYLRHVQTVPFQSGP